MRASGKGAKSEDDERDGVMMAIPAKREREGGAIPIGHGWSGCVCGAHPDYEYAGVAAVELSFLPGKRRARTMRASNARSAVAAVVT